MKLNSTTSHITSIKINQYQSVLLFIAFGQHWLNIFTDLYILGVDRNLEIQWQQAGKVTRIGGTIGDFNHCLYSKNTLLPYVGIGLIGGFIAYLIDAMVQPTISECM